MATLQYTRSHKSGWPIIDNFQLREMALGEVHNALHDHVSGTSDQIIAAVAYLAAYEAICGDRALCDTHMQGVTRMVSLRGGLPALGLDGLLEKMLLWIDSNVAYVTKTRVYFDNSAFPPSRPNFTHPRPNFVRFAASRPSERKRSWWANICGAGLHPMTNPSGLLNFRCTISCTPVLQAVSGNRRLHNASTMLK